MYRLSELTNGSATQRHIHLSFPIVTKLRSQLRGDLFALGFETEIVPCLED
jgi:hypothetical protein